MKDTPLTELDQDDLDALVRVYHPVPPFGPDEIAEAANRVLESPKAEMVEHQRQAQQARDDLLRWAVAALRDPIVSLARKQDAVAVLQRLELTEAEVTCPDFDQHDGWGCSTCGKPPLRA